MTTRREYYQVLDRLTGRVERAYIEAVRTVIDRATLGDIISGVAMADVEAVLGALRMDSAALSLTVEEIRAAFIAGGMMEAEAARILFDVRNPLAERWLAQESAEFVTRITVAQRAAVQVALEQGLVLGQNPRQTALDIVGRVGRTGRRTGGLVGLADTQAKYVYTMRTALSGQYGVGISGLNYAGEPLKKFWIGEDGRLHSTLTRRDRRFDSVIARAIRGGGELSRTQIDQITGRYADRLLQTRGENLARTETIAALNSGRSNALDQAVQAGDVEKQYIENVWQSTGDPRTRHAHMEMNGQRRAYGQPFDSPTGGQMMFPGDTSLGAGPEDVINCRCYMRQEINFAAQAAARERAA